jgi:hypothetical protein
MSATLRRTDLMYGLGRIYRWCCVPGVCPKIEALLGKDPPHMIVFSLICLRIQEPGDIAHSDFRTAHFSGFE